MRKKPASTKRVRHAKSYADISDLVGTADGLPADIGKRSKYYLRKLIRENFARKTARR